MSYSKPKFQNPARKFIEFRDGAFVYWDKDEEKNILIDLPIYFIVLDELSTISGYCEKTKSGIFSNEVHRISDEILNVRTFKGGEQIIGLYKDITDAVARLGGRFTKSVYAILINTGTDDAGELVNFSFRGAAFSSWIDKKFNPEKYAVGIMETVEGTKGKTVYQIPIFKQFKITPELDLQAIEADKILQEHLRIYKNNLIEKEAEKEKEEDVIIPEEYEPEYKTAKDRIVEKAKAEEIVSDLPF